MELLGIIISSVISATSAIVVCVISASVQLKKQQQQTQIQLEIIKYEIIDLKDKVHKHNNLIDRTYKLEEAVSVIKATL